MFVFGYYLLGLILAHVAWLYFFTTGRLLWRTCRDNPQRIGLDTLVITSVGGMALSGFGLLLLGFAHLLNRFGLAGLFLLEAAIFWLLKRDNWLSLIFWKRIFQDFVKSWTLPAFCIYLLFLALGLPAILPPTDYDAVSYHLAYAADWANAGRIYVDPFLRFPYYANNFLLFDSAFFILTLDRYCHFLPWLCGLLTSLGVLAFFTPAEFDSSNDDQQRARFARLYQFLIPVSLALSPVFLAYLNGGYVDVPIGLFVLVSILCTYKAFSHRLFVRELAVIAAFCVGMKLTLIGYLPLFVLSLLLASARQLRRREIALLVVALVALSLPWYVRNLWEAHDPTPPIFNSYFKHPDPIFNQAERGVFSTGKESDLRKPLRLLLLPFEYFIGPGKPPFGRDGVSATFLLVYAPVVFVLVLFCSRKKWHPPKGLVYLSVAATYLALPWFYNADGRHAIHWYPVLVAWVGVVISIVYLRAQRLASPPLARWTRIATAAFCCALIVPSPTQASVAFYRTYYAATSDFAHLGADRERYLEKNVPGYKAVRPVIKTLKSEHKEQTHVLALPMPDLNFYFRKKANIISVGDYFGPARYGDLYHELYQTEGCPSYFSRLNISAVIAQPAPRPPSAWWPRYYAKLRARLKECDYIEYRCGGNTAVFLKRDIKPHVSLRPAP